MFHFKWKQHENADGEPQNDSPVLNYRSGIDERRARGDPMEFLTDLRSGCLREVLAAGIALACLAGLYILARYLAR